MYLIAEFVPIALPESCELPWLDSVGFRVATGVAKPQEDRAYLPAGLGQESYRRNEKMDALYACGSNRLGQLSGNPSIHGDISSFQQIAVGRNIRILFSSFGRTVCRVLTPTGINSMLIGSQMLMMSISIL